MAARRIAMLLSLVALPQVAEAQACNGLAYFKPNTRAMFVGGQADLVANANAFGALFGLTGGGAKAASLIADVRTIQLLLGHRIVALRQLHAHHVDVLGAVAGIDARES